MKVAVLLSGGVDSSLALQLLYQSGEHNLHAFYLKIWLEDELAFLGDCPWEEDLRYAREICDRLRIPLTVKPMQSEYHDRVVQHALSELRRGRTPSPDIFCNQRIKFGAFLEGLDPSFGKVASGHYARITEGPCGPRLERAPDPIKDQTYFLSSLSRDQLSRILFPIGHLHKQEVRRMAEQFDLPSKARKDSQGICFLGKIKYPEFVSFHLGEKSGAILEYGSDRHLGIHKGVWFHTIGQRQGLGLSGGPWYVVAKDLETNRLWVAHGENEDSRGRRTVFISETHWIDEVPVAGSYEVKLRHGPQLHRCVLVPMQGGYFRLDLDSEDRGIAPGQWAILYRGTWCLGGGVIQE